MKVNVSDIIGFYEEGKLFHTCTAEELKAENKGWNYNFSIEDNIKIKGKKREITSICGHNDSRDGTTRYNIEVF